MTLLVGFTAGESGIDALALGVRLVAPSGSDLLAVHVQPENAPEPDSSGVGGGGVGAAGAGATGGGAPGPAVRGEGELAEAHRHLPDDADVKLRTVTAPSAAQGLTAVIDSGAVDGLVLGSGARGEFGLIHASGTADQLLHVAPVPVFLAPRGTAASDWALSRVTVCYQATDAGRSALDHAIDLATACQVPLRLLALVVTVPAEQRVPALVSGHTADPVTLAGLRAEASTILGEARVRVGRARPRVVDPHTRIGIGLDAEAALRDAGWGEGDLMVCGSGSLGPAGRVFLGDMTSRLLRASRVPVMVVPRGPAE